MPTVLHTASMELSRTPDEVAEALRDHLGAEPQPDGSWRALIPDDPSDSGRFEFTVEQGSADTSTKLSISCANDSKLPYFNGVVDAVMLLHYEKAIEYAAGVLRHELEAKATPSRPRRFPLLPPVPYSNEQAIMLVTAGFAIAVATFGQSIIGQYGSPIKKSFSLTNGEYSNLLSVLRVGALVALFAAGLADRIGRRKVVLVSLLGMAAANFISAFAPNAVSLTVFQTIARGFATAVAIVAAVAAIEEAPERARAFATTILALTGGVGFTLTVILLPTADYSKLAWRAMLLISAASALLVRRIASHLEESKRYERVSQLTQQRGKMREVLGPQYRKRFILMALIGFFTNVLAAPSAQLTNTYLTDVHHYSNKFILLFRAGTTTIPGFIAISLTAKLLDRYGRKPVAMVSLSVGAAVRALFFLTGGPILWFASGFGDMALAIGALAIGTQNIELFPTEARGVSNGLVTLISVIGSIAGIQLAGQLSDPLGGIGRSIALCAAGTFVAAIFIVPFLPESNQRDLDDISPPEVVDD